MWGSFLYNLIPLNDLVTEIMSIIGRRHCVVSEGSFEFSTLNEAGLAEFSTPS
ncbi:hypothetical protein GQ43DRAFT_437357 [Delitschia confertaspora ATCC 74209]|uniref:Uncharacterized protein n=1 Tax=Delitschia confertaspora ATCC 74209 TaxID=1513339 RepID=A0A9P4JSW3_9PLEO|nr:hypothetical protein GQ43DRAFT_437357 [Delitschia confertaspora ATCC 74209]